MGLHAAAVRCASPAAGCGRRRCLVPDIRQFREDRPAVTGARRPNRRGEHADEPFGIGTGMPGDPAPDAEALQQRPADRRCRRLAAIAPEMM